MPFPSPLPGAFARREVLIGPGARRPYDPGEWAGALVVVECGVLELEGASGARERLDRGAVLWLADLPLRALHNPGPTTTVLAAIARRAPARDAARQEA